MIAKMITVHCSDSPNSRDIGAKEIREWHLQRGFKDIGYHLIIRRDGTVERGRGLNEKGAHVEGHNEGNIGICLIGKDRFTRAQFDSLRYQIDSILLVYKQIPRHALYCHRTFDRSKTCPNIDQNELLAWYLVHDESIVAKYLG